MNPLVKAARSVKAFALRFVSRTSWAWSYGLGRTTRNYVEAVGDGRGNAIVQSVVGWVCRTWPEAPIRVSLLSRDGEFTPKSDHPLVELLDTPNPFYSGELLWMGTLADWMVTGNAYWLKVRSEVGRVVQLWWVPSTLLEPKWPDDGSAYLSHYEYTPNGVPQHVDPADVVHFRYGFDPLNIRKGLSPIASLVREIFTDDEAANFSASLLGNLGVPGVILSPGDTGDPMPTEDVQAVKATFEASFGGDNRGRAMVLGSKTDVQVLSFNPQQMDLKTLRRLPEERVSAIFGVPAIVVGLGAGLDRSTFANYAEAREAAYESNIIPTQRLFAAELRTQLLPEFGDANRAKVRLDFDLAQVRVLQADQDALHQRAREDLKAGMITRAQALGMIGEDAGPNDDVLYVPISVTPTAPADLLLPAAPVPANVVPLPAAASAASAASGGKEAKPRAIIQVNPALMSGWTAKDSEDLADEVARILDRAATTKATPSVDGFDRLRDRLTTRAEGDVAAFLAAQLERVVSRLDGRKAADVPSADDLVPDSESTLLEAALRGAYVAALSSVSDYVQTQLGTDLPLDDVTVRQFLREVGANIPGITETTREAIREALAEGQAAGESIDLLAARLRGLPAFTRERAMLVARTEMGYAANGASLNRYEASGVVVGVRVFDGDGDGLCAGWNGRTLTLAEARTAPRLGHPQCVRAFGPLTDARDLEVAA